MLKERIHQFSTTMPSVDQVRDVVAGEPKESTVSTAEMEELVRQVGETLRLKAKCKQKTHTIHRKWPYSTKHCTNCLKNNNNHGSDCVLSDSNGRFRGGERYQNDPHKLLQKLLEEGSLIREAVKRLGVKSPNRTENSDIVFHSDL